MSIEFFSRIQINKMNKKGQMRPEKSVGIWDIT